ncbi:MAG: hypothetical protein ABGZ23_13030 [Fuerstiella sp.]
MGAIQPTAGAKHKNSDYDAARFGSLSRHLMDSEQFFQALIGDSGASLQQWERSPFPL